MSARENLEEALAHLAFIQNEIEGFNIGDRPQSPPADLLRAERKAQSVVDWYRAEVERSEKIEAERAGRGGA